MDSLVMALNRCVVVIGPGRTGTSAIAGLLHHLGIFMGERLQEPCPNFTPKGAFEDMEFKEITTSIVGPKWLEPSIPTNIYPESLKRICDFVAKRQNYALWGIKHPNLCLVGQWVLPCLPNPHVIFTHRSVEASCRSFSIAGQHDADLVKKSQPIFFEGQRKISEVYCGPRMDISFDDLVKNPYANALAISEFACPVRPSDSTIRSASLFVEPSLKHF